MKKYFGLAGRISVGAIFLVFGANGIAGVYFGQPFIELPPPKEGSFVAQYIFVLGGSYILKTVKIVEVLGALMLLSGFFLPLGIVILAPIIVNIFLFHMTLEPGDLGMAFFLVFGEAVMVWAYWGYFRPLFTIHKKS